ncbi:hypothetical protein Dimus_002182 [Dionaea muscipula]
MEKLRLPVNDANQANPTWDSSIFSMDIHPGELNPSVADCFFNPSNWDTSIDQNDPFESALSSIVSSPTASYNGGGGGGGDSFMMSELIGRLGSVGNSGDNHIISSTNTSCYSTPLNSPPRSNLRPGNLPMPGNPSSNHHPGLSLFNSTDPGFVERAAKYSSFGSRSFSGLNTQFGFNEPILESGRLSRVSSSMSVDVPGVHMGAPDVKSGSFDQKFAGVFRPSSPGNAELGDSREGSSVSEQNPVVKSQGQGETTTNSRKRKSNPRGKGNEIPSPSPAIPIPIAITKQDKMDDSNYKIRSKAQEVVKRESESMKLATDQDQNGYAKSSSEGHDHEKPPKDTLKPPPEPPKDYIHVRARRGQATDSHSLAERVRREKISERMKFLQDLVPGCSKVTGKAIVLDEIINYVQSLQRQVEFLSMKLATVHPRMDFNMDSLLSKDIFQSQGGALAQHMYALDVSAVQYAFQAQQMQHLQNCFPNGSDTNPFSIHNTLNAGNLQQQGIQMPPTDLFNHNSISHSQVIIFIYQSINQSTVRKPTLPKNRPKDRPRGCLFWT